MKKFNMRRYSMEKKKKNLSRDRKFISESEHKRHRRKTKGKTYVKHKKVAS
jgi:hypothetical protein